VDCIVVTEDTGCVNIVVRNAKPLYIGCVNKEWTVREDIGCVNIAIREVRAALYRVCQ